MNLDGLSIIELKQLLARVNHDLKMNKPTLKRIKQEKAPVLSEADICNQYALKYTGNKAVTPEYNQKIKADIQIQRDILDYINDGNMIKTSNTTGRLNSKPVKGARAGIRLYRRFAV